MKDGDKLLQRCAKAELLLERIAGARFAFSLDPGGPERPLEGLCVIEGWIKRYFNGSYYGNIRASEASVARIQETL